MKKGKIILIIGLLLLIPIVFALDDTTYTVLQTKGAMVCSDDKTYWTDYSEESLPRYPTLGDSANCFAPSSNPDNPIIGQTECCPDGYKCIQTPQSLSSGGDPVGHCVYQGRYYCMQFNQSQNDCERNTSASIANRSVPSNIQCGALSDLYDLEGTSMKCINETICKCAWNATSTRCDAIENHTQTCADGTAMVERVPGSCTWTVNSWNDLCSTDGIIEVQWQGFLEGEYIDSVDTCTGKSEIIECASSIKMGFFSITNIIIAVVLIAIIYYLFSKKKTNSKKRKK